MLTLIYVQSKTNEKTKGKKKTYLEITNKHKTNNHRYRYIYLCNREQAEKIEQKRYRKKVKYEDF